MASTPAPVRPRVSAKAPAAVRRILRRLRAFLAAADDEVSPAGALFGVGPSAARQLSEIGIWTIGDLAHADLAVLRKTGARGLRAILEDVLGPVMFDVPSADDVAKVIITKAAVETGVAPTIVMARNSRRAEKSA